MQIRNAKREAILIMESRGLGNAVRSSFNHVWSRLYQAGDFYIDMSLNPADKTASLQGQLLPIDELSPQPEGHVVLKQDDDVVHTFALGDTGDFSLQINTAASYQLVLELASQTLTVSDLHVN